MKTLYKIRYECVLIVLLCMIPGLFIFVSAENAFFRGIGLTIDIVLVFLVLRRLYKIKWRRVLAVGLQKIFSAVTKRFSHWMEQRQNRHKRNIISGETNIRFHFEEAEPSSRQVKKPLRWKQLKTERERIKYLYRKTVNGRIRRGARIYRSHTPEEIKALDGNTEADLKILSLYSQYRYDERTEPTDGIAEQLKEQQ